MPDQLSTRPHYFRLSHRSMFRRQRITLVSILLLALIISLPTILYTTVSNYLAAAKDSKERVYGAFSDIYYDQPTGNPMQWERDVEKALQGFRYQRAGVLLGLGREVQANGSEVVWGYVDEEARDLGRIRLLEGEWPLNSEDVALTSSALSALADESEPLAIGSTIKIGDKHFEISGIVADFGRQWVRGNTQIDRKLVPPQILLARSGVDALLTEANDSFWRIVIFEREAGSQKLTAPPPDQFFYNSEINMIDESRTYSVPDLYTYVLICAVFAVQLLVFGLFFKERLPVHRVLQLLGLSKRRDQGLQLYEMFVVLVLSSLLSLPVTMLFSWGAFRLISRLGSFHYMYQPELSTVLYRNGLGLATGVLAALLVAAFQLKTKRRQHKSRRAPRRIRSHHGAFRLALWDIRLSPGSFVTAVAVCLLCAAFFTLNAEYHAVYQAQSPVNRTTAEGFLPLDYDYELLVDGTKMGNTHHADEQTIVQIGEQVDNPVTFFNDQYGFGADQAFADRLAAIPGLSHVHAYRQINQVYLALEGKPDDWSDALDGEQDGQVDSMGPELFINDADKKAYQVPDLMLPTQLLGYPEEQLQEFATAVSEGAINMEAIRRGEEVILIVPDMEINTMESDDGRTVTYNYVSEPSEDTLRYNNDKVGDTIDLYGMFSNEKIWGMVAGEQFDAHLRFFHHQARVGAIIRTRIGEFDQPYGPPSFVSVAVLNDSFIALDLPANYVRLRGYLNSRADGLSVDAAIRDLAAENPVMPLKNLRQQMEDFHIYRIFLSFFLTLLNVMLFFIAVTILISIYSGKLEAARREYILLRLNGQSLLRFAGMWAVQSIMALIISAAIFVSGVLAYAVYIKKTQFAETIHAYHLFDTYKLQGLHWLVPWLITILCLTLLIIASVRQLRAFGLKPDRR